jgi:hypothetical protein
MTMSLVCTSTNTISKQEHMATPSLNDQPFIDTTYSFNLINFSLLNSSLKTPQLLNAMAAS